MANHKGSNGSHQKCVFSFVKYIVMTHMEYISFGIQYQVSDARIVSVKCVDRSSSPLTIHHLFDTTFDFQKMFIDIFVMNHIWI